MAMAPALAHLSPTVYFEDRDHFMDLLRHICLLRPLRAQRDQNFQAQLNTARDGAPFRA